MEGKKTGGCRLLQLQKPQILPQAHPHQAIPQNTGLNKDFEEERVRHAESDLQCTVGDRAGGHAWSVQQVYLAAAERKLEQ